ncbi:hypothetical protein EC396_03135 [Lutibacter sp. HS1-25]|uniref:hypothetical protein n=1 Tax=Lutibacter sp. HS1-25 TaxID=2485000 RepID=UPI0010110E2C|nr:hypothetical protein [Lutibacter sp. HS1-25]RXP62726.1 hypothetical protein EC396_03135 [Lutibacter sp. HS1-25]
MKKYLTFIFIVFLTCNIGFSQVVIKKVNAFGYNNCIELSNPIVKVILDPNVGGRILSYELNGKNILFENPLLNGITWEPGMDKFEVSGGRFDIGPAQTTPNRNSFHNKWNGEITGKNSARLTSQIDTLLEVQLIRDFILAEDSSHLKCIQHIKNTSKTIQTYAHWSRTFAKGGGICLVPLNPNSRLPKGYAMYQHQTTFIDFNPKEEENLRVRDGILEMLGTPSQPKFVMDSNQGWLAYNSTDDLLFIKKFEADKNVNYGDVLSNQVSIWYYKNEKCEIEPIGPIETILPGEIVSFTEDWWLLKNAYPKDKKLDLNNIKTIVKNLK